MTQRISNNIFLHRILKGIGDSILKVFIPLLIYKQTNNLMLCFMWAALNQAFAGVFYILLKNFIKKYPIIAVILHILPLLLGQFFIIGELTIIKIIILACLDGLSNILYFGGLNLVFGFMEKSPNAAKYESGEKIGKIICSLISVFILGNLKDSLLFVVIFATVLYIISILPLILKYKELQISIDFETKVGFKQAFSNSKWFYFYEISVNIVHSFMSTILPLFLYVKGLSFTLAGTVIGLQEALRIAGNYLGLLFIKIKKQLILIFACCSVILISICLAFLIPNKYLIYALTLLVGFAYQGQFVIMFSFFIKHEKEKHQFQDSIFYRDIVAQFTRMATFSNYLIFAFFPVLFATGMFFSGFMAFSSYKCFKKYETASENKLASIEPSKCE